MDLSRLFDPRSVAVVGASDREGSYGGQTLVNLRTLGYEGEVWGVNPRRDRVHGFDCFPSLGELPETPDAVVVAVPAASVPEVIDEAGRLGSGGAVVYGAGFGEIEEGRSLQDELVAAARHHELPVCGPNGNGIVVFPRRVAIWGDALSAREPGEVAIVSQSGNQAVNALSSRRGVRFHTVVSCGNQAVLEAADFLHHLAAKGEVRSVALNLEADGDGARLCEALAACADAGIGVAVLKVGSSEAGASAAAAHTGAIAGDQRVFAALLAEAGAVPVTDPHDLLEVAKTLALRKPAACPRPHDLLANRASDLAVMTCSGGDSSAAGDEADRVGLSFPPFSAETERRLEDLVPHAATVANPLDYTAMIWGERDRLRELITTVADDPGVGRVLVFYDEPGDLEGDPKTSWEAVREGILDGARASSVPVIVSSTLPELLQDDSAARFVAAGVPAIAGLRSGILCAAALATPPGDAARLREVAAFAHGASDQKARDSLANRALESGADRASGSWLPEHEAKELLRQAGVPVVEGRVARDEDEAVAILAELGPPVAAKLSGEDLRHKSELGALVLELTSEAEVRDAHGRLRALRSGAVLIERHVPAGVELLVSARRTGVVPSLTIGLGGIWTEALDDAVVVPLPAAPERVERAVGELRGSGLLTGGRGRPSLDVASVARLAAGVGDLLLDAQLELVELNPVVVYEDGAVALDAVARTSAPAPHPAAVSQ
ncbi:MAG TPA: acetate--CoA ligase family protein [Solirubrobacterales bacterium]|nr:acetate--CoA ligase family protein [Solirubrobacterales bacterium]